ncbi:MAG: choline monooxygenase [Planctomycetota bacterium]
MILKQTDDSWDLPTVGPDVTKARTLPGWVHGDGRFLEMTKSVILPGAWGYVGHGGEIPAAGDVLPTRLFPGSLDEPGALTRDEKGSLRLISNVCTHRANLVVREAGNCRELRCNYHGRRFALDGSLRGSPGFEGACNFPSATDDLPAFDCGEIGPAIFGALKPTLSFPDWTDPLRARLGHLPWDQLKPMPERDRDFEVKASWILYVENYLEGFHVPYVHPGLSAAIDVGTYSHELFPWGTLQVAEARPDEAALPTSPLDGGRRVAGHYLWLFPGTMLNLYPWGLSLNAVEPLAVDRTLVRFRTFVWDESKLDQGAGADLDQVEIEDEQVVEACQRGNTSRAYGSGRYAPLHEAGMHRFHRLLLEVLRGGWKDAHQRA